jgi:hypothetical protein
MSGALRHLVETGEHKASALLQDLVDAFPAGVPTHILVERHAWKAQARIVELRKAGWRIERRGPKPSPSPSTRSCR